MPAVRAIEVEPGRLGHRHGVEHLAVRAAERVAGPRGSRGGSTQVLAGRAD